MPAPRVRPLLPRLKGIPTGPPDRVSRSPIRSRSGSGSACVEDSHVFKEASMKKVGTFRVHGRRITNIPNRSPVRDKRRATDMAPEPSASFGAGHSAKEHSDGLRIFNPEGAHVATFHTPHVAQPDASGRL